MVVNGSDFDGGTGAGGRGMLHGCVSHVTEGIFLNQFQPLLRSRSLAVRRSARGLKALRHMVGTLPSNLSLSAELG